MPKRFHPYKKFNVIKATFIANGDDSSDEEEFFVSGDLIKQSNINNVPECQMKML